MEATIQIPSEMYEARINRVLGLTIVEHVDFQSWFVYSDITRVVLNYETKSKRNEQNETKRNITKHNEIY